jgi:hypothetical protein
VLPLQSLFTHPHGLSLQQIGRYGKSTGQLG